MFRLVLISFVFMGWAFYQLSGGSDFDPDAVRAARMEKLDLDAPTPKPVAEPAVIAEAPKVVVKSETPQAPEVTKVALNLTSIKTVPARQNPTVAGAAVAISSEGADPEKIAAVQNVVPQNVNVVTSSADTPAIIPSLITPATLAPTETEQDTSLLAGFEDVRTVSGSRVNVRGGPGTGFGIVGRLDRGDAIKVLQDNGAGWVRFETPDGATTGWMADFLLNDG